MHILECITEGEIFTFGASNALIHNVYESKKGGSDIIRYYFYLKDKVKYVMVSPGLYISRSEFPDDVKVDGEDFHRPIILPH